MRSSFKHMAVRIISITIIVTIIGVYVYTSYFHYYEGRNNKQNEAAKRVYVYGKIEMQKKGSKSA